MLKKNYRFIIGIVIGILLTGTSVYAANTIYSKNVTYDNSGSGLSSVNVQDALDELYLKMYPSRFYKKLYESAVRDDKSSTYVSSNDGIDFSEISSNTNGKGLYISSEYSDYKYPILYYRGDVNNNNLIFAGFCWKIVRTTETGGIKLIYNGVPSNGVCNVTGEDTQIGTSAFNTEYPSPAYVGYMYGTPYIRVVKNMSGNNSNYYYGKDATYSNGIYTLTDTIYSSWTNVWEGKLNSNHYTCLGGTTCSIVYFVYYASSSYMYYISLSNGKKLEDALSEMLDYNKTSSTIKNVLDNWYYTNIDKKGFSNKVEDTVWCNDRKIQHYDNWNQYGGNTNANLYFDIRYRLGEGFPNLECTRKVDRFTVSTDNGNGALDYPVGLITADEATLAGGKLNISNSSYYLNNGQDWWTMSPWYFFYDTAVEFHLDPSGALAGSHFNNILLGVRPSIALSPNVEISSGTGTANSPYIVE